MKYTVRVLMHPQQDFYAASKLYTGLLRLEAKGLARVSFSVDPSAGRDPVVSVWQVKAEDGPTRIVALDLYDRSNRFTRPILESCDIYFKRSFSPCRVHDLPADLVDKVVPMGPNFACQAAGLNARTLRALGINFAVGIARAFFFDKERYHDARHVLSQFVTLPRVEEFEADGREHLKPVVLLQTRVWEPADVSEDDVEAVNEGRADLVRKLRKELGDRFIGGIVPTEWALKKFPDVITRLPSRRDQYIAMSRSAPIAIYCRGLHHSTAFKLGEYLAGAKAIIMEPLFHHLRAPLEEGKHFLGFETTDQCVEHSRQLLDDPDRLEAMRRQNHFYYREHAEPSADVLKCLQQACAVPSSK
jgi:hypothetical protein